MRTRSLAAVAAFTMAGVGLVAAPAQADVQPEFCSYTITTKHNGQHLMTIKGVISVWGGTPVNETNDSAHIQWYEDTPTGRVFFRINRRLVGLSVSVNLERAGVDVARMYRVGIWTQPGQSQEDACSPR